MKKQIFIFFLFATIVVSSQVSTVQYQNQLKFAPMRLWWLDRGIELNYERFFSPHFSTQVTARYITDVFINTPQRSYKNLKGVAFYIEPKYFFQPVDNVRDFASLSFGFQDCSFENIDEFIKKNSDTVKVRYLFHTDTVNIRRQTIDMAINYGVQQYYKNFVFKFSLGLGLRFRDVKLTNKLYEDAEMYRHLHEMHIAMHRDGALIVPNIPIRIRVGYCF